MATRDSIVKMRGPTVAPSLEEAPLEKRSFVVLHSLKNVTMNDRTGEVVGFTSTASTSNDEEDQEPEERAMIALTQPGSPDDFTTIGKTSKVVKIKLANLKRIPLKPYPLRHRVHGQADSFNHAVLIQCVKQDPTCVFAHARLSHLEALRKQFPQAVAHQQRVCAHMYAAEGFYQPGERLEFIIQLGNCLGENGDLQEQAETLQKVLAVAPTHREARYAFAVNRINSGGTLEALDVLEDIVRSLSAPNGYPTHTPTGEFHEDPYSLANIKVQARHVFKQEVCALMQGLLVPNDTNAAEKYDHGLLYANRLLAIPELPVEYRAEALVFKALALVLIQYSNGIFDASETPRWDHWDEVKQYNQEALDVCRNDAELSPPVKGFILESNAKMWAIRGDFYSSTTNAAVDETTAMIARECQEQSAQLYQELSQTNTEPRYPVPPGGAPLTILSDSRTNGLVDREVFHGAASRKRLR